MKNCSPCHPLLFAAFAAFTILSPEAHAANRTWTGAAGLPFNWSDAGNWDGAVSLGDHLYFIDNTGFATYNDLASSTNLYGIHFGAEAGAFVLTGNTVTLGNTSPVNLAQITSASDNDQTINLALSLRNSVSITVSGTGDLILNGGISNLHNSYSITKEGAGKLVIAGQGGGTSAASVFNVNAGSVELNHARAAEYAYAIATGASVTFGTTSDTYYISRMNSGNVLLEDTAGNGINLVMTNSTGAGNYTGILSGKGSLTYSAGGVNMYEINAVQTYTGGTTISSGNLRIGEAGRLGAGLLTVNGGLLRFYTDQTVSGLNGSGGIIDGQSNKSRTLIIDNTGVHQYSGIVRNFDSGAQAYHLIKRGAGNQILNGINTYTGTTLIENGTLTVNGELSSNSHVTIREDGQLTGRGHVRGLVTMEEGSALAAGDNVNDLPIGILTLGAAALGGNNSILIDLNSDGSGTAGVNWDRLTITGIFDLTALDESSPLTIFLNTLNGLEEGAMLSWDDSVDHVWKGIVTTGSGFGGVIDPGIFVVDTSGFENSFSGSFSIVQDGETLDLIYHAIPEPGTYLVLIGGLLLGIALPRRPSVKV